LTAFRGSILEDRGVAVASSAQTTVLTRLAKLPSLAARVRSFVPWLRRTSAATRSTPEALVLEFESPEEVLFALALPLKFAKLLRRRNSDGWLGAKASGVRHHHERTAAARGDVPNWIVKS
jgi:hypothetical protein